MSNLVQIQSRHHVRQEISPKCLLLITASLKYNCNIHTKDRIKSSAPKVTDIFLSLPNRWEKPSPTSKG